MIDVKVVKYCRLDLESWTDEGVGVVEEVVGGDANIAGIFSFALLQRGKIHELVCHFSTFPADAATREFFLQTCEYRSESCYITGSSAPVWMDVAPLLMERFSSVLSCSVGKRTWRRRQRQWEGWEGRGLGEIVFQDLELWRGWNRNPQCTGDVWEPCGGKPCQQSDMQCSVWISLQYCWNAHFRKLHYKHWFSESASKHDSGNAEFDLKIKFKALAKKLHYVCRNLKLKHYGLVKCGLALLFYYLPQFKREVHLRRPTAEQRKSL